MADSISEPQGETSVATSTQAPLPTGWLSQWPWVTFLLPMLVFMVATSFEPTPPPQAARTAQAETESAAEPALQQLDDENFSPETVSGATEPSESFWAADPGEGFLPAISYSYYPQVYTAKLVLTLLAILLVWPGYRTFPFRVSWLSLAVGVVGVVFWIVLCHLRLEPKVIGPIDEFLGSFIPGLEAGDTPSIGLMSMLGTGTRSAFNPLVQLAAAPLWAYGFLIIRFIGLALIVPVIEEFFLRGFMMRYLIQEKWWQVPFGTVNRAALVAGTAIPMLMHPGELLASLVWFSMVTWLMLRTRNIWDCVVAHAVTNFLLGVYVVWFDQWQLM